MHSKPFYSQPRLTPILPVADHDACLIGGYSPCPPCHVTLPQTPPSSSPTLQDLSPVAYSKCLPNSPSHAAPSGPIMPHIQESPGCPSLPHPSSPDHSSPMGMLHSQGSPNHLNSPGTHGYHAIYANSSPSSSPISHPSTPGATAESPLVQAYSPTQAQAAAGSPGLLHDDASPPPMAITVKQEPQELDQMYLDDGEFSEIHDAQTVLNVAFGGQWEGDTFLQMKAYLHTLSWLLMWLLHLFNTLSLSVSPHAHSRTLLPLTEFPDESVAAVLRQICFNFRPGTFICLRCTMPSGVCCLMLCRFTIKQ